MAETVIIPQDIKDRFDEAASVSEGKIQVLIDDTRPFFNITRWGDFYVRAHCLYVMHSLTERTRAENGDTNPSFPVASQTADSVAVSYSTPEAPFDEAWLASTVYGQEFLRYKRIVCFGGWTPNVTA